MESISSAISAGMMMGLVGSIHCAAMCGPLALASCTRERTIDLRKSAGYFGGRVTTYAFMGALFGHLGDRTSAIGLLPVQRIVLVLLAALFFARGASILRRARTSSRPVQIGGLRRSPLEPLLRVLALPRRGLAVGLVTGLLPCGMLVSGWALAASSADPLRGALAMASLAAASMPGLAAPVLLQRPIARVRWLGSPLVSAALWCILGMWIGMRPLFETFHHCMAPGGQ
jgi:uncharacterized protein